MLFKEILLNLILIFSIYFHFSPFLATLRTEASGFPAVNQSLVIFDSLQEILTSPFVTSSEEINKRKCQSTVYLWIINFILVTFSGNAANGGVRISCSESKPGGATSTIAEEAVDQLQENEKLVAGESTWSINYCTGVFTGPFVCLFVRGCWPVAEEWEARCGWAPHIV